MVDVGVFNCYNLFSSSPPADCPNNPQIGGCLFLGPMLCIDQQGIIVMNLLLPVYFVAVTTLSGQVEENYGYIPQLPDPNTLLMQQRGLAAADNVKYKLTIRVNCKPRTQELCAWGANVGNQDQVVYYIDPNSDLYGKVSPGDRIILADGIPYQQYYHQRMNFGRPGEVVNVRVQHQDGRPMETILVRKKPISCFSPAIADRVRRHPE
jgi:hypothetical protein